MGRRTGVVEGLSDTPTTLSHVDLLQTFAYV